MPVERFLRRGAINESRKNKNRLKTAKKSVVEDKAIIRVPNGFKHREKQQVHADCLRNNHL